MGDSKKDTNNKQENSADIENHNENADEPPEYGSSNNSEISNIISSDDIGKEKSSDNKKFSEDKASNNSDSSSKQKSVANSVKKEDISDKSEDSQEHLNEDTTYHFPVQFEHDFINFLKTNRDKIIKGSALVIGGFLILYGLVLVSASVTKVADNVIFGEDATADAFLILLGVLIIVAAFAQSILDKTSLSKIGSELEVNDENSESNDNSKNVKENDNKVSDDNKDNIVGENKR
jgi:hypothetical protein